MVQLSQQYMATGKTIALTIWTFVGRVISLLLNTLSRFVIAFLPRSNHLLISDFMAAVTIRSDFEEEICHYFHLSPLYLPCSNGDEYCGLSCFFFFLIFSLKPALSLSSFTLTSKLFSSSSLSAIRGVS